MAVDELEPGFGVGRIGLGGFPLQDLLDLLDRGQEVLVLGIGLAGRVVELGQIDAALGQEVLVTDGFVELLEQIGFVLGGQGRELGRLLGQVGIDLERLELGEGEILGPQPGRGAAAETAQAEVGSAVPLGQTEVDALVQPGINDLGILLEDGQAGAAELGLDRQALGQHPPGLAAVHGLVEVVAGLAVDIGPGAPIGLIGGGDDDVGIARVEDEIGRAPVLDAGGQEDVGPGLAAVRALVQAALAVHGVVVELALGRDVNDVGVLGVDRDLGDEEALLQADLGPGLAGVRRFPDAVAMGRGPGVHRLARAQVKDRGIGRRDGHIAHAHVAVFVEQRLEMDAAVLCFPQSARGGQDVIGLALAAGNRKLGDAAGERDRPDPAPGKLVEVLGRQRRLGQGRGPQTEDASQGQNGHYDFGRPVFHLRSS